MNYKFAFPFVNHDWLMKLKISDNSYAIDQIWQKLSVDKGSVKYSQVAKKKIKDEKN